MSWATFWTSDSDFVYLFACMKVFFQKSLEAFWRDWAQKNMQITNKSFAIRHFMKMPLIFYAHCSIAYII